MIRRVAAAQLRIGRNQKENLEASIRALEEAAQCGAELLVLPEFCNHVSWYENTEHCHNVAVTLEGEFLNEFSTRVGELGLYAVINCTIRRDPNGVTGTSLLYSPAGEILAESDKQVLIGHENDSARHQRVSGSGYLHRAFSNVFMYGRCNQRNSQRACFARCADSL